MRIKKQEEFLNEAASWPSGSIGVVTSKRNLGRYDYGWSTYNPSQADGTEGGVFYFKVEHSGRKWLEGPMIVGNCLYDFSKYKKYRVDKDMLSKPGPEYAIFVKEKALESPIMGKSFFLDGNEDGLLKMDGTKADVAEGEYLAMSLNFKLTAEKGTTVFFFKNKAKDVFFCATMETAKGFGKELSNDQKTVIAEWFSKELGGADIEVNGDEFQLTKWFVKAGRVKGYPEGFSAGPFVTKKQADEVLASILKLNKYSLFDPAEAKTEADSSYYSKTRLSLDALIDWCRSVGVKTTMKELLALRKAAVTGKKFGL